MDSNSKQASNAQAQRWKKWLSSEMGEVKEGQSKQAWQTWKPNAENPAEKPWLIWNAGEGLRDDRPCNATSYSFKLNEKESK